MQKIVVEFCYLIKKYYVCNVKNKNSMTGTAQISVILPFCNSKRTLAACVESILSQSYSRFELLVADYGSTDGSDKIINTFEDQRIRVVKRVNGYARALNSLVEQAEGKYIVCMDAGYMMSEGRLQKQLNYMEQHSGVALMGGYVEQIEAEGVSLIHDVPLQVTPLDLVGYCCIHTPTVVIRSKIIKKEDGLYYDESCGTLADYALYCTMAQKGMKLCNVEEVFAKTCLWPKCEDFSLKDDVSWNIRLNLASWIKKCEYEVMHDYQTLPPSDKKLSVCISFLNEGEEVGKTVKCIRETVGETVEIIVINDASDDGYDYEADLRGMNVYYYVNKMRIGAAESKEKAVQICGTPYFLLLDAHMRFYTKDWAEVIVTEIERNPNCLYCCKSRVLTKSGDGVVCDEKDVKEHGAYLRFDLNSFVPRINWMGQSRMPYLCEPQIPAILGATYATSKSYWNRLKGLEGLIHYGCEEQYLSVKAWLEGGGCRLIDNVIIGHIYRDDAPYRRVFAPIVYNYVVVVKTLFPTSERGWALAAIQKNYPKAYEPLNVLSTLNMSQLAELRRYFEQTFKVNDFSYIRKINNVVTFENVLVLGEWGKRLPTIIQEIEGELKENHEMNLFCGKVGYMLALAEYAEIYRDVEVDKNASCLLSKILDALEAMDFSVSLSGGIAGIGWALIYLLRHNLLKDSLEKELKYIDHRIMEYDVSRVSDKSFKTGIGGILAYVVTRLGMLNSFSESGFDEKYLSGLKLVAEEIIADSNSDVRTLSYAYQFVFCMEQGKWNILPPKVSDLLELPVFVPKEGKYQKKGLYGKAGLALFLLGRIRAAGSLYPDLLDEVKK